MAEPEDLTRVVHGQASRQRHAFAFIGAHEPEASLRTLEGLDNRCTAQSCWESRLFSARSTGQTVGWVLAAFKEWDGVSLPDEVVGGKLSEAKRMSTAFKQNRC